MCSMATTKLNNDNDNGNNNIIAISNEELNQWGCIHCGFRSGHFSIQVYGTGIWNCGDCGRESVILTKGEEKSLIGLGSTNNETFYPMIGDHPRRGIPSHGKKDIRPDGGGEYYYLRSSGSIGLDYTNGCLFCGKKVEQSNGETYEIYMNNISGFVNTKEAGERIVQMSSSKGIRMDYRKNEPDYIQVKIGVCDEHLSVLHHLVNILNKRQDTEEENVFNQEDIEKVLFVDLSVNLSDGYENVNCFRKAEFLFSETEISKLINNFVDQILNQPEEKLCQIYETYPKVKDEIREKMINKALEVFYKKFENNNDGIFQVNDLANGVFAICCNIREEFMWRNGWLEDDEYDISRQVYECYSGGDMTRLMEKWKKIFVEMLFTEGRGKFIIY